MQNHKIISRSGLVFDFYGWAFWINYSYRIKFIFSGEDEVLFLDIGPHDIYK